MPVKNKEKVMEFVREELAEDPDRGSAEIYEKAKEVDSGVGNLTLRQFNARFPLQVKRRQALERSSTRGNGRGARTARARRGVASLRVHNAVRETFLRFAADLSSADDNAQLVRIIAGVDEYVESVIEATK